MAATQTALVDDRSAGAIATLGAIALEPVDAEEELVAKAQAGDRAALERLLRDHFDAVYAVCRRMAGNDADGADAAQEAMIAIARGIGRFDGRSRLSTWIYRISVNAAIDELRRRSRRPVVGLDESAIGGTPATDGVDVRVDVDAALRKLPESLRAAVVLRDLCGLDYAEIADVLDIPPGTVRSRISRGRAALADTLGPARSVP